MLTPENTLVDITPNHALDSYPFIIATESEEDFFAKSEYLTQEGNLVHFYK